MPDVNEAERIQMRMQRVRRRMENGVDDLISDAQQLMDWQYYVSRYPIASALGGLLAAYALVPAKRTVNESKVYLDPATTEKFLKNQGDAVRAASATASEAPAKTGLVLTLGTIALNYAARQGMTMASQFVRDTFLKEFSPEQKPTQPMSRPAPR